MKVLLGTTNPSKVKRFSKLLENCDIEFITLKDLEINRMRQEKRRKKMQYAKQDIMANILTW